MIAPTQAEDYYGLVTLITVLAGFALQWFREARAHRWQEAAAEKLAQRTEQTATGLAEKVSADTIALTTTSVRENAALTQKVFESAQRLSDRVTENIAISNEAAQGAKGAFTEANTVNNKIADLQRQLVTIAEHVERIGAATLEAEKAAHEEAIFNERIKVAIDEKLRDMNSPARRARR